VNLHALVAPAIGTVNPHVSATLRRAGGYTTQADGTQVPSYQNYPVVAQVQALSAGDLRQLEGLNIQGARRAVYISGHAFGVVRVGRQGGDLFVFPSGTLPEGDVWLCVHVLEQWPDWCKCALTLQNGS